MWYSLVEQRQPAGVAVVAAHLCVGRLVKAGGVGEGWGQGGVVVNGGGGVARRWRQGLGVRGGVVVVWVLLRERGAVVLVAGGGCRGTRGSPSRTQCLPL